MTDKNEPEVVEAETIDGELGRVSFELDTGMLADDMREVARNVSAAQTALRQYGCDSEAIAELSYASAKTYEQALSAAIKAADESRKRLKGDFTQPVKDMEAKFADLMRPVRDMHEAMKERRITCEELAKARKKQELLDFYREFAPMIAVAQRDADKPLVPFEAIFDPRWLNKSVSVRKAQEAIEAKCDEIAELERAFDAMEWGEDRAECKAVMFAKLSIEEACKRRQANIGARERCRAMDEQRAAAAKAFYETEVTAEQARGIEPPAKPQGDPSRRRRVVFAATEFEFDATRAECAELASCMRRFGIRGSIKTIKEEANE